MVCMCGGGGEHFSDGWSNMKISGSFNCSGLFEVHASVCHPNYALHHQSFKVQRYTVFRSKATKKANLFRSEMQPFQSLVWFGILADSLFYFL